MAMIDMVKEIKSDSWKPIVVRVSGLYGYGVDDLIKVIDDRFRELMNNGKLNEMLISRRVLEMRLYAYDLLEKSLSERRDLEKEVVNGRLSPQEAARRLLNAGKPRLDHVAIAVKNLDSAVEKFRRLGLRVSEPMIVEEQGVKIAMVWLGNTRIELLEPLNPGSTVARFLESRGEGIHHIALEVDDLDEFIKTAKGSGLVIIGGPSKGAEGVVVFIHPRA